MPELRVFHTLRLKKVRGTAERLQEHPAASKLQVPQSRHGSAEPPSSDPEALLDRCAISATSTASQENIVQLILWT